jgi:SAM-dependent methyltransferase
MGESSGLGRMPIFTGDSDRSWEAYGQQEPYFGVLTSEQFLRRNLDDAARAEFFASGERHVEQVLADVQRLAPGFRPRRALDFGCGVGRLLIPLARRAREAVGVDIAPSMLAEARANCERLEIGNVTLAPSDDALSAVEGTFDFVHSYIVFQHMPVKRGEAVVRELVRRLEPGGAGALHFTFGPWRGARDVAHWARKHVPLVNNAMNLAKGRPFFAPMMQVNNYDLDRIVTILDRGGCPVSQLRATHHQGRYGAVVTFHKAGAAPLPH